MFLAIFWCSIALIIYTYLVFPLLVMVRGKLFPKPLASADAQPTVSFIIAAHNEERSIGDKIENLLQMDYPKDCLEVIIASDGSSDRTNEIVERYSDRNVKLLALPRAGKAAALNSAISTCTNEILVFSDANSMFATDALRHLVGPFADTKVGGVAGNQVYRNDAPASVTDMGERGYWNFDRRMKYFQSQAGNVISATGAIYAIRRSLFRRVPEGVTDDFITSTGVIELGARLVFEPKAIAFEPVAQKSSAEFGRKVRVITRGLRGVWLRYRLLNPFRYGFYSIQLFSHKLLRRLMFVPLILVLLSSIALFSEGMFFRLATICQLAFYGLALLSVMVRNHPIGRHKLVSLPAFFVMVNAACAVAVYKSLQGERVVLWEPHRTPAHSSSGEQRATTN